LPAPERDKRSHLRIRHLAPRVLIGGKNNNSRLINTLDKTMSKLAILLQNRHLEWSRLC